MRKALESDWQAISGVVMAAFGNVQGQEIADLITDLLEDPSAYPLLSLVATTNDRVVGYILFTSTQIKHSRQIVTSRNKGVKSLILTNDIWDSEMSRSKI